MKTFNVMSLVAILACILAVMGLYVDKTFINTPLVNISQKDDFEKVSKRHEFVFDITNVKLRTSDNVVIKDVNMKVSYNLNPNTTFELFSRTSKSSHVLDVEKNEILLMRHFITTISHNALHQVARTYQAESFHLVDNKTNIEKQILEYMNNILAKEFLNNMLFISKVQIDLNIK